MSTSLSLLSRTIPGVALGTKILKYPCRLWWQIKDSRQIPESGICLEFVWNSSGICLEFVWNVFGICRLEVVWDLSDISLESLILVPRGTPGIVRDSNDKEVLTE